MRLACQEPTTSCQGSVAGTITCSIILSNDAPWVASMVQIAAFLSYTVVWATTAYACLTYEHSPIFERPAQSSIFVLAFSGVLYLLFCRLIPSAFFLASSKPPNPTLPPHKETAWKDNISAVQNPWRVIATLPTRLQRELFMSACALCVIVELFRLKLHDRQCYESRGVTLWGFLPFLLLCSKHEQGWRELTQIVRRPPTFAHLVQNGDKSLLYISYLGLGSACLMTRYAVFGPSSSYICPVSSYVYTLAPWIDFLNLMLSWFFLRAMGNIVESAGRLTVDQRRSPFSEGVGYVFLIASSILFLYGIMASITQPMNWQWLFNFDKSYVVSLLWHGLIFTAFVLAATQTVFEHGSVSPIFLIIFTATLMSGLQRATNDRSMFGLPGSMVHGTYVVALSSSLVLHLMSGGIGAWEAHPYSLIKPSKLSFLTFVLLTIPFGWFTRNESLKFDSHPLWSDIGGAPSLIKNAAAQAFEWEKQASSSQSLHEAVIEYRRRHRRHPPPGFDAWYRYATERNCVVIDDYDSIYTDLKPFWGMEAAEIRLRTAQVISDTWNDVSEIRIRDGKADLGPNFQPTHRWMLDGILSMIEDFSLFLPDMDLAFNLNDEPRVTVPFAAMQDLEETASHSLTKDATRPSSSLWDPDRDLQWDPLAEVQPTRPFTDTPRINSFSSATVACPPTSKARTSFFWNPQPLCLACFAPHSIGPFLSNWTLAASPCHQPDLRNLHGLYLSPAAFKTSKTLLPIFSQAKVAGFADILYPSPWNYIDKAVYAPDNTTYRDPFFRLKENTLFWRGGTSEGVSRFGTWKGMARQRMVHLTNNAASSASVPRLVPHPTKPGKFTCTTLPLPDFNISIVAEFARAWDNDGAAQAAEFKLAPPVEFQQHWQYRFLFDTDGAGFSGRFLPFLHSRSLPFRAGIFRTWFDDRLTAWRHFVPVDIRLHGLVATLEYFSGRRAVEGGMLEGDDRRGGEIAEAGREWAGKVLRKEDMEVYMFRLLLEWGRVTDDRREEIGFVMPE